MSNYFIVVDFVQYQYVTPVPNTKTINVHRNSIFRSILRIKVNEKFFLEENVPIAHIIEVAIVELINERTAIIFHFTIHIMTLWNSFILSPTRLSLHTFVLKAHV